MTTKNRKLIEKRVVESDRAAMMEQATNVLSILSHKETLHLDSEATSYNNGYELTKTEQELYDEACKFLMKEFVKGPVPSVAIETKLETESTVGEES